MDGDAPTLAMTRDRYHPSTLVESVGYYCVLVVEA